MNNSIEYVFLQTASLLQHVKIMLHIIISTHKDKVIRVYAILLYADCTYADPVPHIILYYYNRTI